MNSPLKQDFSITLFKVNEFKTRALDITKSWKIKLFEKADAPAILSFFIFFGVMHTLQGTFKRSYHQ